MSKQPLQSCGVGLCVLFMLSLPVGAGLIFTTTAGTVAPDSFFDVTVRLDTEGQTLYGYDIHLSVDNAGDGMFALTGRSVAGSPVNDPTPSGLPSLVSPDILNPESGIYGATPNPFVAVPADADLFLTTFSVHVLPTASSGTYEISLTNWALYWGDETSTVGDVGPAINVTVPVPEPGSVALLLLALPSTLLLRRRRS